MSGVADLVKMAEANEQAAKMALDVGARFGYDASREALEYANIARQLRLAAAEIALMPADKQPAYVARMKAAVWARLDDSPEIANDYSEAHP